MDVKHVTASLQQSLGQAHVDPEQGRQGDFDHWQRIFEATDGRSGAAANAPASGGDLYKADHPTSGPWHPHDGGPLRAQTLSSASFAQGGQAGSPGMPLSGAAKPQAGGGQPSLAAAHQPPGTRAPATTAERLPASTTGTAESLPQPDGAPTLPDGRPLAQLEAHLSRNADGRLNVTLRSSLPLSTSQALHAVAQALSEQGGDAPVDQVIINGQPIYRSATSSTHRFEIDC